MTLNFRDYLDFADKQLNMAGDNKGYSQMIDWLLIPATILAWSAIESFINNRLDDFSSLDNGILELHEKAFLLERRLKLENNGCNIGHFILEGTDYSRIEDKIFFLLAKFGKTKGRKLNKGDKLWQQFVEFKEVRDAIVHPRINNQVELTIEKVQEFITTSKEIIQLVSMNVWNMKIEF